MSVVATSRAFREPPALLDTSSAVEVMPRRTPLGESVAVAAGRLCVPLGESGAVATGPLRTPLGESGAVAARVPRTPPDESGAVAAGPLRTPLGESGAVATRPLRTPLSESDVAAKEAPRALLGESGAVAEGSLRIPLTESGAVAAGLFLMPLSADAEAGLCAPGDESVVAAAGAFRAPLESAPTVPGLFGAMALEGALGAVPTALAAGELMGVGGADAFAAEGLPLGSPGAGDTGGMPNPAGEGAFWVSATALAGGTGEEALGEAARAAASAAPCGGFTSLAAESAPEVAPFPGSSVNSNSSNPSKSSESGSKGDLSVTAADVPVIPAASASLNASARRSGSPPSKLSGSIISSTSSSELAWRDPAWVLDDDGAVPTGTLPSMGASTGRSASGSKMGRDAASIISSLVDASSNTNQSSTERARPRSLVESSAPWLFTRWAYLSNASPAKPRDGSHNGQPESQTVTLVTLKLRQPERACVRSTGLRSICGDQRPAGMGRGGGRRIAPRLALGMRHRGGGWRIALPCGSVGSVRWCSRGASRARIGFVRER